MSRFSTDNQHVDRQETADDPMTAALVAIDQSQAATRRGRPTNAAIDNAQREAQKLGWNALMSPNAPQHAMGRRRQVIPTAQITLRVRPELLQAFLNYCADQNVTQGRGFERLIQTLPEEFFALNYGEGG